MQKILHRMIEGIPWLRSALIFFMNAVWMFCGSSQMCELFHPFRDIFPMFMLWFCPAVWSRDMTMYGVFLAFASRPIYLLAASNTYQNPNSSTNRSEAVQCFMKIRWVVVELLHSNRTTDVTCGIISFWQLLVTKARNAESRQNVCAVFYRTSRGLWYSRVISCSN